MFHNWPVGRWVLAARINNLASERGWSAIITSTVRRQGSLSRGCHLLPAAAESAPLLSAAAAVWRETAHQQDGARARCRLTFATHPPGHRSDFAVMSRRPGGRRHVRSGGRLSDTLMWN